MHDLSVKNKEITRLRQILTKGSTKLLNQKKEYEKEVMAKNASSKSSRKSWTRTDWSGVSLKSSLRRLR